MDFKSDGATQGVSIHQSMVFATVKKAIAHCESARVLSVKPAHTDRMTVPICERVH